MINRRVLAATLLLGAVATTPAAAQVSLSGDGPVLADFARRVQSYVEVRDRAAESVQALRTLPDPGLIRRRTDNLAAVIQWSRREARQGDLFTPDIARLIRRVVRAGCDDNYAELIALINEDLGAPLPAPVVNGRWPPGQPLPTMMPDLLAALPPLPAGLQYRFMNRALLLLDIDANLIVDFVPDVIPTTDTGTAPSLTLAAR